MRRYLFSLLFILIIYLAGAFIAASFNIGNWDTNGRIACSTFMIIFMFIGFFFGDYLEKN